MNVKTKKFIGLSLFYIAYCVFPFFTQLIPPWLSAIVVSAYIIYSYPGMVFRNKTFWWFIVYGLIVFLFVYLGRVIKIDIGPCTTLNQLIIEYAFLLPNILLSLTLFQVQDEKIFKILGHGTLALLVVSFMVLLPFMGQMDLRDMANELMNDKSQANRGALNYTLLHAYIIIIPALYCCFTTFKKNMRLLYLVGLSLVIYIILKSSITTNIVLLLIILPLSIVNASKNKQKVVFLIIFLGVFALAAYYSGLILSFLDIIQPFFEGTAVEEKIESYKILLTTGSRTGSIEARDNYHEVSWVSFFDNIIIGGGRAGGHSSILDRLGDMGLVGFVPYFMMYYTICKQWYKYIPKLVSRYYLLGVLAAVVLLYSKGLFGQEGNLFLMVLLPIFILLPQFSNNKTIK